MAVLVGQFVSPSMVGGLGRLHGLGSAKWYVGRYKVHSNKPLNKMVSGRVVPGRILLHIDSGSHDMETCYDTAVVIGCFHPNGARGSKQKFGPKKRAESRHLACRTWAVDAVSAVDSLLMAGKPWK
jgi:hypothetical protein